MLNFLEERIPLFIDRETGQIIQVTTSKIKDLTFPEIFTHFRIPWIGTIRGYKLNNFIIFYTNDYEIPNIGLDFVSYTFTYFPDVEWVGLGCIKGQVGELWEPRLVIRRTNSDLWNDISSKQPKTSI